MKFPVAIQVYSVRKEAENNLYGTLKKIKAMGYDGVEFAGLYGHKPEEIREMCADIGLTPISAHVPYLDMIKDHPDTFLEDTMADFLKANPGYEGLKFRLIYLPDETISILERFEMSNIRFERTEE